MKAHANLHEKAEDVYLQTKTDKNDVVAHLHVTLLLRLRKYAAATRLHQETKHVAPDETARHDRRMDDGYFIAVDAVYDASEDRVDGGGKEDGCEEDEEGLSDVRWQGLGVVVGAGSSGVAGCFELDSGISCCGDTVEAAVTHHSADDKGYAKPGALLY